MLEHFVRAQVIEFSQCSMDSLWVLKGHISFSGTLEDSLWLSSENDLTECQVVFVGALNISLHKVVVYLKVMQSLVLGSLLSGISALVKDFNEILNDWFKGLVIKTVNLMGSKSVWAFHGS